MTNDQKDALLQYLEFSLTQMVEGLEVQGIINGQPQVGAVYDAAYDVLNDIENTLTEHIEICAQERSPIVR